MSGEPVRFYFDFISPYAYVAWTQVHALAERHGREVDPVPVLFAALLDAHGTKGPAEVPAKRMYVFKDSFRHAAAAGVPLRTPPSHPFNPLLGLRIASIPMPKEERRRVIDILYAATWGGGPGITDAATVSSLLTDAMLDGPDLVARATTDVIKAAVKAQTEEALSRGAFGVPTLIVDGELFWGYDSFGHVARRLAGRDPLTPELLASFKDVAPSAVRPGSTR